VPQEQVPGIFEVMLDLKQEPCSVVSVANYSSACPGFQNFLAKVVLQQQ